MKEDLWSTLKTSRGIKLAIVTQLKKVTVLNFSIPITNRPVHWPEFGENLEHQMWNDYILLIMQLTQ